MSYYYIYWERKGLPFHISGKRALGGTYIPIYWFFLYYFSPFSPPPLPAPFLSIPAWQRRGGAGALSAPVQGEGIQDHNSSSKRQSAVPLRPSTLSNLLLWQFSRPPRSMWTPGFGSVCGGAPMKDSTSRFCPLDFFNKLVDKAFQELQLVSQTLRISSLQRRWAHPRKFGKNLDYFFASA